MIQGENNKDFFYLFQDLNKINIRLFGALPFPGYH